MHFNIKTADYWLKLNRGWGRDQNIEHARFMLARAKTAKDRAFWQLILEQLEGTK